MSETCVDISDRPADGPQCLQDVPGSAIDDNLDGMSWAIPEYTRSEVDSAGEIIRRPSARLSEPDGWDNAVAIASNWRSSHSYPLQALKMTLRNRAKLVDPKALVAQRLKRLSSIAAKLLRFEKMKLSRMQDLGGCRAVVRTVGQVDALVERYQTSLAKNPTERAEFVKKYDYIANPKSDGYRSVHFVYKYRSRAPQHQLYNGMRTEIQIRSRLQHAWATAVETVDMSTRQALKSGIGHPSWMRFFALMGSAIALREKRALVPDTPTDRATLTEELRTLASQLQIFDVLQGLVAGVDVATTIKNAHTYLLILDAKQRLTTVQAYGVRDLSLAAADYMRVEKEHVGDRSIQAVLVSVDSMAGLRSAYPNFYLDTTVFLDAVRKTIGD
jgi:ppGpp synthetase/RelA/SpoT-type nucleotidyltranferase